MADDTTPRRRRRRPRKKPAAGEHGSGAPQKATHERPRRPGRSHGPRRPSARTVDARRRERERLGTIVFPEQLPVSARRDEIAAAVRDHQVVVLAGETGSGKTTQLPKICLELGRGVTGMIGHTQPRRIAARAVATRLADELGTDVGAGVGFAVRFTDEVSDATLVKVMTDGILLNELQHDRDLSAYDTLIIDEAHERSLTIDFLLGYLRQLLPRRPDLKVIVTSATIDPERFAAHFAATDGTPAPVFEVSGRTYPVELRYRPVVDPDDPRTVDRDQTQAVLDAVDELAAEPAGDVLVFLSGEREIRDTADALTAHLKGSRGHSEVLPLYARLSSAEQQRVFSEHPGRRIVLATNVAETSLTVPGIRYVVDPGYARISRYNTRSKVQQLPIEPISQASANQRAGRCGRVADGICLRLFAEEDFESRPEFTQPEILRTNLASVILQMTALGLGDVNRFPFLEPPEDKRVNDGVALLTELGALRPRAKRGDPARQTGRGRAGADLTKVGRVLARLPLDPRLARMIVEADRLGCTHEVIVVVAALSITDPRERPTDAEDQARAAHRRFADPTSDFTGYLNLWKYLREQRHELSGNAFRRLCRDEYLNYLRVREWSDVVSQLRRIARDNGIAVPRPHEDDPQGAVDADRVHTAILSGLLGQLGALDPTATGRDAGTYQGSRGTRFAIFPGSALFRSRPPLVMAAELVDTSRLWAREVARIDPAWAEKLAGDLVKRQYAEPHWERKRAAVTAYETVTLYGVTLVSRRPVNYDRIDPEHCRELFIRHALVEGDWDGRHAFLAHNAAEIEAIAELEDRVRRRDLLVDEDTLVRFYDDRIPAEVTSGRRFDGWWKQARRDEPQLLDLRREDLLRDDDGDGTDALTGFPTTHRAAGVDLPLTYTFEPGAESDGVTLDVPVSLLNQLSEADVDDPVPGQTVELITALIRSLPKQLRRLVVPAPDVARQVDAAIAGRSGPVGELVAAALRNLRDVRVAATDFDWTKVPDHLRTTIRVTDSDGSELATGKDLGLLQDRLTDQVTADLSAGWELEQSGLTDWTFGELPISVSSERPGFTATGYPALVDTDSAVDLRVLGDPGSAEAATRRGIRRLLLLALDELLVRQRRHAVSRLSPRDRVVLGQVPGGVSTLDLLADTSTAVLDLLQRRWTREHGEVRDRDAYVALREEVRSEAGDVLADVLPRLVGVLAVAQQVGGRLRGSISPALLAAVTDVRAQFDDLLRPGFVVDRGADRLGDLERYLQAMEIRLDKAAQDPARDRALAARFAAAQQAFDARAAGSDDLTADPGLDRARRLLEEFRVSLWAQQLGTSEPVSYERIAAVLTSH